MARSKSIRPRSARASTLQSHIEAQRRRLLGADAIVVCVQRALDSRQAPPDEIRIADALEVASALINDAVVALDSVSLAKAGGAS